MRDAVIFDIGTTAPDDRPSMIIEGSKEYYMAHPVDLHVGKRIRQRRWLVGMTQQQWLSRLELNFSKFRNMKPGRTG